MSKKVEDAKKKCARLTSELEKAQETIKESQKRYKAKEAELSKANMDLIHLMLVENNLTIQDLPDLITELGPAASNNPDSSSHDNQTY